MQAIQQSQAADPLVRRSIRVMTMLSELHKVGFQRLRCEPYQHSTGHWRFLIAPAALFDPRHGALVERDRADAWARPHGRPWFSLCPTYTIASGADGSYFDWSDAMDDNARQLAQKLLERFPLLQADGAGWDYAYAGWYLHLLGVAEAGWFPVTRSDWHQPSARGIQLLQMTSAVMGSDPDSERLLPLPPPP